MLRFLTRVALGLTLLVALLIAFVAWPLDQHSLKIPDSKKFVVTIIDDTDRSTLANIKPIYSLLHDLGIKATKTVWLEPTNNPENTSNLGDSLKDDDYFQFVKYLQHSGFEIALHGIRGGSTTRKEIESGLLKFRELFGHGPHVYVNHSSNKDNLYWGEERFFFAPIRWIYSAQKKTQAGFFEGTTEESTYFWGDLAKNHVTYVRNFVFTDLNTLNANPTMPYHDPTKNYVNYWFSASDGNTSQQFNRLLEPANIDRLENEGGIAIIYTHFGKGFVEDGAVNTTTKQRLLDLSSRNAHFATVSETMTLLRENDIGGAIPFRELLQMECRWLLSQISAVFGSERM